MAVCFDIIVKSKNLRHS